MKNLKKIAVMVALTTNLVSFGQEKEIKKSLFDKKNEVKLGASILVSGLHLCYEISMI